MASVFTTSIWTVKPGHDEEWVAQWRELADWIVTSFPGEAHPPSLYRDLDNRSRFLASEEWDSVESVKRCRRHPEFKRRVEALLGGPAARVEEPTLDPIVGRTDRPEPPPGALAKVAGVATHNDQLIVQLHRLVDRLREEADGLMTSTADVTLLTNPQNLLSASTPCDLFQLYLFNGASNSIFANLIAAGKRIGFFGPIAGGTTSGPFDLRGYRIAPRDVLSLHVTSGFVANVIQSLVIYQGSATLPPVQRGYRVSQGARNPASSDEGPRSAPWAIAPLPKTVAEARDVGQREREGVEKPLTVEAFLQYLVGAWVLCTADALSQIPEFKDALGEWGLLFDPDGRWAALFESDGELHRSTGWGTEGSWVVQDISATNPMISTGIFNLNLTVDGGGGITFQPTFATSPPLMRLQGPGMMGPRMRAPGQMGRNASNLEYVKLDRSIPKPSPRASSSYRTWRSIGS